MDDNQCIFCKIIAGEINSYKVYEDNDFIAILDINPVSKGHTLLLPKQHFSIMPQIPADVIGRMGVAVKKISNIMLKMLGAKATTIYIANGGAAGQIAPHFMVHIIPNYGDKEPIIKEPEKELDQKEFEKQTAEIKTRLFGSQTPLPKQQPQSETKENNCYENRPDNKKSDNTEKQNREEHDKTNQKTQSKNKENTASYKNNKEPEQNKDKQSESVDFNKIGDMFK